MQAVDPGHRSALAGPVLFFDGDCVLCNGFADFVLRRDRRRLVRLATLQGATATLLPPEVRRAGVAGEGAADSADFKSIVLWDGGFIFRKSDAVIRVLSALGGVWRLAAAVARILPGPLRDAVYDLVARNRFGWFGRRAACRIPTDAEGGRFLP